MESKKVKVIKEILESCADNKKPCYKCKYYGKCEKLLDKQNILTLINELESENKSLQDLCNKTYEDLTKEIDRLENRVKELEEGIAKSMLGCEFLPKCTNDKLKQFAERLKEELQGIVGANYIDELLKEFIKD